MIYMRQRVSVILVFILFLFLLMVNLVQPCLGSSHYKKMVVNKDDLDINQSVSDSSISTDWTVLYYICEGMGPYIDPLLENLSRIGSKDQLNIVALVDRPGPDNSSIIFINSTGTKISLNEQLGWPNEVETNDSKTFEEFCINLITEFPANHYAVITYASGGTGWQRYNLDDSKGKGLSTPEFAQSLERITHEINHKIDVLFTSCCMSSIELCYGIEPYVNYLVSTQEHITGYRLIQRYYLAIEDLAHNTSLHPQEFAQRAAENHVPQECYYWESYGKKILPIAEKLDQLPFEKVHTVKIKTSVAVINLSRIENVITSVNNLSVYFLHSLEEDDEIRDILKCSRENTRMFGKVSTKHTLMNILYSFYPFNTFLADKSHPVNQAIINMSWMTIGRLYQHLPLELFAYDCRLDLYDLTDQIDSRTQNSTLKQLCKNVQNNINDTVITIKKINDDPSHGINIYFPGRKITYNKFVGGGVVPSPYEALRFSKDTNWDDFLHSYLHIS